MDKTDLTNRACLILQMLHLLQTIMRIFIYTFFVLLLGCSVNYSSKSAVSLSGNQPIEEKVEIAREIALSLWQGSLKDQLKKQFNKLENVNLDTSLGLKYFHTKFTPNDKSKEPRDIVSISCIFKSQDKNLNTEVTEFCISQVKKELDIRGIKYEM